MAGEVSGRTPPATTFDWSVLPDDLPVPQDDGAAAHLVGLRWPDLVLHATDGRDVDLATTPGRTVVYAYPRTGRPDDQPGRVDWDLLPGARGCTAQACDIRDHHGELRDAGARVLGLSTQGTAHQQELVERLHLPFALLSDEDLRLTRALDLPTMTSDGMVLLRRFTLVVTDGVIEHCWYPVFPPNTHAAQVLTWLLAQRS